MEVLFYLFSTISVLSTIAVILSVYPMHALLYLIISFLSISCVFFILGAYFAGALEIIIYAGAIAVLFIFVVMLLNIDFSIPKRGSLVVQYDSIKIFLIFIFFMIFLFFIWHESNVCYIDNNIVSREVVTLKSIGVSLFGPYVLVVEMASMLLLAALIISLHVGRYNKKNIKK